MTKQKIAIVGAGPAGLSAAFNLTDPHANPDWKDRYEVDVYQLGWRCGGKGATGRNVDACDRIEEHGIHLFGSNYFNSFRMLKACFEELEWDEHDKFRTVEEAFKPSTFTWGMDYIGGKWYGSEGRFPLTEGNPWTGSADPDPLLIVQSVLSLLSDELEAFIARKPGRKGPLKVLDSLRRWLTSRFFRYAYKVGLRFWQEATEPVPPGHHERHVEVLDLLQKGKEIFEWYVGLDPNDPSRLSKFVSIDMAVTALNGLIEDDIFIKGIDVIDGENYRDWLEKHGASPITLAASSLQSIPNTALSYEYGDTTKIPSMAAATFITFALRALVGKGAGGYFFAEGTGETVIKPLFRLLVQRGVRFHFFHKLADITPDPELPLIDQLTFDVQARVRQEPYDPLRRLGGDGELVWPDRPNYEQLVEGEAIRNGGFDLESWWTPWTPVARKQVTRGVDFDHVVLATPVATFEFTGKQLMTHRTQGDRWTRMVNRVKTAATQSIQLWLSETTNDLGWTTPPDVGDRHVGATFGQDLTCYCDFSDLIEEERWPDDNRPKGLIYLIGALPDPDEIPPFSDSGYPKRRLDEIRWTTAQWLRNAGPLLPGSARCPIDLRSFDFDLLVDHRPRTVPSRGVNRLSQQFIKANIDPNERYTLSMPGTVNDRMESWDSGFDNLALAGDWVYNGYNVGSFEAAVMGGKLASLALTGSPTIDQVWGYSFLHPDRPGPDRPPLMSVNLPATRVAEPT